MKHLQQILIATILLASAETQAEKLLHKADVRVMGPGSRVLVFYKDGSDIVIKNCGDDYAVVEKRSDCKGKENRVPVKEFKKSLIAEFTIQDYDRLKPLTPEELQHYRNGKVDNQAVLKAQEKELDDKLNRIKYFIEQGSSGDKLNNDLNITENKLEKVREDLKRGLAKSAAINKVNQLIKELVDKISDSETLHKVSNGREFDQAMFSILSEYDLSKGTCGTDEILQRIRDYDPGLEDNGADGAVRKATWLLQIILPEAQASTITIEDRIKNCVSLPGAVKKTKSGVVWNLVTRTRSPDGKIYETWRDSKTGLVWGDLVGWDAHYNVVSLDPQGGVSKERFCDDEGVKKRRNGGITEKKFGLPTMEEFMTAEKNGIREALPNIDKLYWTADAVKTECNTDCREGRKWDRDRIINMYDGNTGGFGFARRADPFFARCVGR